MTVLKVDWSVADMVPLKVTTVSTLAGAIFAAAGWLTGAIFAAVGWLVVPPPPLALEKQEPACAGHFVPGSNLSETVTCSDNSGPVLTFTVWAWHGVLSVMAKSFENLASQPLVTIMQKLALLQPT